MASPSAYMAAQITSSRNPTIGFATTNCNSSLNTSGMVRRFYLASRPCMRGVRRRRPISYSASRTCSLDSWLQFCEAVQSGTHDFRRISSLAGCGNSQHRGCEEVVETDLRAESLFPSTEGTLSSKLPSSPQVGAQGPRTVARRF